MYSNGNKEQNSLLRKAELFIRQFYDETGMDGIENRLSDLRQEIHDTGTYKHRFDELAFGAKVAWRNSNRCIGRIFYDTLEVLDCRDLSEPNEVIAALEQHIRTATNEGNIKSVISIFQPSHPATAEQIRIWNSKLIRYAGYRTADGIIGDPEEADFTEVCEKLGWKGAGTSFDILPVVIEMPGKAPIWFEINPDIILEVEIEHPDLEWFKDLGLKWYAVPVIADMVLEIGGIHYTAAPFNGWFMETEIGSRNFGDEHRYNILPEVAKRMKLDTRSDRSLWKDRAMLELNQAVLYSFRKKGVRITDHHTASKQFTTFCKKEADEGREVMADWSWIIPPMSGSSMQVFHEQWSNQVKSPNYFYNNPAWKKDVGLPAKSSCPFHINSKLKHQT